MLSNTIGLDTLKNPLSSLMDNLALIAYARATSTKPNFYGQPPFNYSAIIVKHLLAARLSELTDGYLVSVLCIKLMFGLVR